MLTREQALALVGHSKLPEGQTCVACCNYESHCRTVLASSKGFLDPGTTICYWQPSRYGDPLGFSSTPEQLAVLREYRKAR